MPDLDTWTRKPTRKKKNGQGTPVVAPPNAGRKFFFDERSKSRCPAALSISASRGRDLDMANVQVCPSVQVEEAADSTPPSLNPAAYAEPLHLLARLLVRAHLAEQEAARVAAECAEKEEHEAPRTVR